MSTFDKAGYFAGSFIMVSIWFVTMFAYLFHVLHTITTIGDAAHSGQAFYLVTGILFPPLGVFNGLFVLLV